MFADDTTVLTSHKNLNVLINTFNVELSKISTWFKCNKLSLNISFKKFMHFQTTSSNPDIPIPYDIRIDGIPLHRKDYTKFLGITIDKQLTWSQHIADHIITNGQRNRYTLQNKAPFVSEIPSYAL